MELDRKELKHLARERIGNAAPPFWTVALAYILLTTGVSLILDLISSFLENPQGGINTFAIFLSLLVSLYTVVIDFGMKLWSLWTWRQLDPDLGALTQGFSVVGKVLILQAYLFLRMIPWTFLLSAVASVAALVIFSLGGGLVPVFALLLFPCMFLGLWLIMLRYSLAHYLLADRPDDGPSMAVRRSVLLMRGWVGELFKLEFSFLGWEALCRILSALAAGFFLLRSGGLSSFWTAGNPEELIVSIQSIMYEIPTQLLSALLTLPILLWLTPYRETARAGFYDERLRLHREQLSADQPPL